MKTRTRKANTSTNKSSKASEAKIALQTLEPSISNPPQVFILPKDCSPDARIITLPSPANGSPNRYLVCPEKGCFEFTRIAAPKKACRSWLLAPNHLSAQEGAVVATNGSAGEESEDVDQGYVLQTPDMMIGTPIDPLFLILPALLQTDEETGGMQMHLSVSDYINRLEEKSEHFKEVMRCNGSTKIEAMFEDRILAVSDFIEAGDETLYKMSNPRLLEVLAEKAKSMVEHGLPASLEERFIKQALSVPVLSVKREESSMSLAEAECVDGQGVPESDESAALSVSTSQQESQASSTLTESSGSTAVTSFSSTPAQDDLSTPAEEVKHLLRLRIALNFILSSYMPSTLRSELNTLLSVSSSSPIDFEPLDKHLDKLSGLRKEAQALRSLSENISRKRGIVDEEAEEARAEKKRKKEEDEARKKNVSRGVQQLAKADTKGMKKLSSFFGAKPAVKKGA